jgi:hypothetical protein
VTKQRQQIVVATEPRMVARRSFVCLWWTVEVCASMHLKPNRVFLSVRAAIVGTDTLMSLV